jgi:hypothetical protein
MSRVPPNDDAPPSEEERAAAAALAHALDGSDALGAEPSLRSAAMLAQAEAWSRAPAIARAAKARALSAPPPRTHAWTWVGAGGAAALAAAALVFAVWPQSSGAELVLPDPPAALNTAQLSAASGEPGGLEALVSQTDAHRRVSHSALRAQLEGSNPSLPSRRSGS